MHNINLKKKKRKSFEKMKLNFYYLVDNRIRFHYLFKKNLLLMLCSLKPDRDIQRFFVSNFECSKELSTTRTQIFFASDFWPRCPLSSRRLLIPI